MTNSLGRRLVASALSAFVIAIIVHVSMVLAFTISSLAGSTGPSWLTTVVGVSNYFSLASVFGFILLAVAGSIDAFSRWWTALIAGAVVGAIAAVLNTLVVLLGRGTTFSWDLFGFVLASLGGLNLLFVVLFAVLTPTFGRWLYRVVAAYPGRARAGSRIALVRIPASNLVDGLTTHIDREPVSPELADQQWDGYVAALAAAGWETVEVAPADSLADSVFVEDTAVVFGDTAVITRPGADSRRAETAGTEAALQAQGLEIVRIQEPGTLDGGDVLKVGSTVFVGRGGRTNAEGIRQLRALVTPLGYAVVAVPVTKALHLKTAVTALPDGTVIGYAPIVDDPSVFGRFLAVPEAHGTAVVVLSDDTVLMSASAPQSAALVADLGYNVITVDISEFEKLEGCVTCLSIRIRG
jgi:dimethylargininase